MNETKEMFKKVEEFAKMVERFELDKDLPPHQKLHTLETFMTSNPFPNIDNSLLKETKSKAERLKRSLATQIRLKNH